jgi:hypothetical protein
MIKDFILKFVAALAGVEHDLARSNYNGHHMFDAVDRPVLSYWPLMPYNVVTIQRVASSNRLSRLESDFARDRLSEHCL